MLCPPIRNAIKKRSSAFHIKIPVNSFSGGKGRPQYKYKIQVSNKIIKEKKILAVILNACSDVLKSAKSCSARTLDCSYKWT